MSSYLLACHYVEPKFPPCEEYSHPDYLPPQPDFYPARDRHLPGAPQPPYAPCRPASSPPPPCEQPHPPSPASSPTGPVVYPWMKKVHVNVVSSNSTGEGEPKRSRSAYTRQQVLELEKEFHYSRYLTRRRRLEVAHTLSLSERQIKIWFQNRRMKWKKDHKLPNTKVRAGNTTTTT
ncbi:homeobox protein Hox-B4a-like [Nerophis lumbriciformis]|uniref:homeobox protein Hox-B4a-like n=1 Tax=Nerophis lumbriciformis TaxID=546530 RepID=UPI002ADF8F19|nr:homeobox protein Hox-B4a-like [Nerophis lumbriciformis]